ncbi:hypothetical protein [Desulfosoma caldarium]|uniref:Uncharacterized protein n=1 Tax=Desulfosoma caldarium TaxID=610254 RepID=A0A3N1UXP9_9BACT|nr:hypothetical protein [Desulfosoma caldarium]ROQ93440.1 hypothetical protein EDC27_1459 [Desulfosoma caldarium]
MTLLQACRESAKILQRNPELAALYRDAVRRYGEGELFLVLMDLMAKAYEDGALEEAVFKNPQGLLSFCCGAWIQFLLVEVAGMKKTDLHAVARKIFKETHNNRSIH